MEARNTNRMSFGDVLYLLTEITSSCTLLSESGAGWDVGRGFQSMKWQNVMRTLNTVLVTLPESMRSPQVMAGDSNQGGSMLIH